MDFNNGANTQQQNNSNQQNRKYNNHKHHNRFHFHKHKHHNNNHNNNGNNINKQEGITKFNNFNTQNNNNKHRHFHFRHHNHHHNHIHNLNETSIKQSKTFAVVMVTMLTMIAEIFFGCISGSMALLADGIHMGTHAFALFLSFLAYVFISKIANKKNHERVSTKISAFAGYTSALILLLSAIWIIVESVSRFIHPITINCNEAIFVAAIGLLVNVVCLFVMHGGNSSHRDFNFMAAYLHIATDALTSVFAIVALLCAKYFGIVMFDPLMGIVGGLLILRWGTNIIKESSKELMDIKLLS